VVVVATVVTTVVTTHVVVPALTTEAVGTTGRTVRKGLGLLGRIPDASPLWTALGKKTAESGLKALVAELQIEGAMKGGIRATRHE